MTERRISIGHNSQETYTKVQKIKKIRKSRYRHKYKYRYIGKTTCDNRITDYEWAKCLRYLYKFMIVRNNGDFISFNVLKFYYEF